MAGALCMGYSYVELTRVRLIVIRRTMSEHVGLDNILVSPLPVGLRALVTLCLLHAPSDCRSVPVSR